MERQNIEWFVGDIASVDVQVIPHLRWSSQLLIDLCNKHGTKMVFLRLPLKGEIIESLFSIANVDANEDGVKLSALIGKPVRYGTDADFNKILASIYDDESMNVSMDLS